MRKRKRKTALIVATNHGVSGNIVTRLGGTGYDAVVHLDPTSAVETAMSGQFDLCLLQMGKGKHTGTELAFGLRRAGFRSPIVGFVPAERGRELGHVVVWSAGAKRTAEVQRLMKVLKRTAGEG